MSDGSISIKQEVYMHIKQELDTTTSSTGGIGGGGAPTSCCSPTTTSTPLSVNRSNSYSNGTSTTSSSSAGGGGGGGGNCRPSTSNSHTSSGGGHKSSPSVSPERQLCSSTTTLSSDLHSVSLSGGGHDGGLVSSNGGVVSVGGSGVGIVGGSTSSSSSIRDELRRLCLVCGDVASGFHYGVASCEACKAFFKRTIQGNIEYTCPANNECEINKRRRKACQACRFQKCLLMGMLKEGVRLDRVRGGRQKYRRNPVSNSYQTMQLLYQSSTTTLDDVKILEVLNSYEPETLAVQQQPPPPPSHQQHTQSHKTITITTTTSDDSQQSAPTPGPPQIKHEHPSTTTPTVITSTALVAACIFPHNNNNDPQEILCVLSDLYDKELVGVIGWAKQIPGFTELPLNDQMRLLQVSWAEILTLQLTFRSLPFNGKLCFATDVWMDELLAKECGYAEFYYHCVQIAQRLERLSPRREEYYLLKALLLSNCDILLDDQSSLRAFRDTILNALNDVVYLLRHSAAVSHQQQLLLLLPALRQADGILRRFWRQVCRDGTATMKKLFVEMLEPVSMR